MNVLDLNDLELIQFRGEQESGHLYSFAALTDRVIASLEAGGLAGDKLPWSKTHDSVALGPSELSIWCGVNGHGKTMLLNQIMASLLPSRKILIASMEMGPEEIIKSIATQAAGCKPSSAYIKTFTVQHEHNGFIYDRQDKVAQDAILGLAHYAGDRLGVDHMVIDSLTMCGVGRENYEEQAEFVRLIKLAARKYKFHIHLVCHARKGAKENEPIGKFDIRGAGEIADIADKVFIVQRNKTREQHVHLRDNNRPFEQKYIDQPGVWLKLVKNRQDGTEKTWGLYFHKPALQFVTQDGRRMEL